MQFLFDIYSSPFYLYYKNKTKYSTNVSKTLSLISLLLSFILLIILFKENKYNLITYNLLENNEITILNNQIIIGIINII